MQKKAISIMKKFIILFCISFMSHASHATIHKVLVWDGYFQFVEAITFQRDITIQLGDTVQWLPLDMPSMVHTITSTSIPAGAAPFDQIWQAPADTFFQYIPQMVGLYEYECTPHAISFGMIGSITVINSPSSVNETSYPKLVAYPNPAKDVIRINRTGKAIDYILYDSKGEIKLSGITENTIDISSLNSGLFFLRISGTKPQILKILKQ